MTVDIVEQVKERTKLEDLVREDGFDLPRRQTRYLKAPHSNGLVVDTRTQTYHWNGRGEYGDVIQWVQGQKGYDFKGAVEWLARRAGLPDPTWGQDQSTRLAARRKEDCLSVASRVFQGWFWKSEEAKAYALGRGWTLARESDEGETPTAGTAQQALLGFSGEGTKAERDEMRRELQLSGVDLTSPEAIAILGMQGDVASWAKSHGLELPDSWVLDKYVPGMIGRKRIVYTHVRAGRVVYLSGRSIEDKWHYNLPEPLVGGRQVLYNTAYTVSADQVVLVEGQADALSLGQWGIAAVALCGVKLDDDLVEMLGERHKTLYIGLDVDVTGVNQAWTAADQIGPMVRLFCPRDLRGFSFPVKADMHERERGLVDRANGLMQSLSKVFSFPLGQDEAGFEDKERAVKDSNDLLQAMTERGVSEADQRKAAKDVLRAAPAFVELAATWAGTRQGAERDEAVRTALGVISRMGELELSQYRAKLAKALGVGVRELSNMLKTFQEKEEKDQRSGDAIYTWGGYIGGFLVEYLYDIEKHESSLAWRTPEGEISSGKSVEIDGRWYEAYPPNEMTRTGSVIFPSKVGDKKPLSELVAYIELYIKSIYLLPSGQVARLMAYYVVMTWMYDAFEAIMYLRAMGPAGAGKSELMTRIGMVCYRMMTASGAASTSSLFRAVERYKGTVFIDEADIQGSDAESEMIKFYNQGAMRGRPIWRSVEVVGPDGNRTYEERGYQVFCPKLIAMRKDFTDDAVGSRSMTFKLQPREMTELLHAKIPLSVTADMRSKASALRNLLLRYRLEMWQPEIEIDPAFYDLSISARLNQVAGPLLAMAKDDPGQQEEIRNNLREYYNESILDKSMTIAARVIEALWKIYKYKDLHFLYVKEEPDGTELIKIGNLTKIADDIMNEMNDEDDDERSNSKRLRPHRVGRIVREELQMEMTERRRDGFWVIWNEPRLRGLSVRFGIDPEDFGPKDGERYFEGEPGEELKITKGDQGRLV